MLLVLFITVNILTNIHNENISFLILKKTRQNLKTKNPLQPYTTDFFTLPTGYSGAEKLYALDAESTIKAARRQ